MVLFSVQLFGFVFLHASYFCTVVSLFMFAASFFTRLWSDFSIEFCVFCFCQALKLAGEILQRSPEAIPKFLVVFVEGQQYVSNGIALLREASRLFRTLGVTVYVVGIGNKLSRQELNSMVQNSEHIVTVSSYAEMLRHVGSLSDLIGMRPLYNYD